MWFAVDIAADTLVTAEAGALVGVPLIAGVIPHRITAVTITNG